ncbi:MAG: hypothetical protein JNK28_01195 [Burkholderiaceae bacterium]|nr:hypothetical protein [Burkholderiaceae bacterium]
MRRFHGYVHEQLQSDRPDEILQHARARIGLWKTGKLCSSYYIRFCSGVVAAARERIANHKKRLKLT